MNTIEIIDFIKLHTNGQIEHWMLFGVTVRATNKMRHVGAVRAKVHPADCGWTPSDRLQRALDSFDLAL